MPPRIQIWNPNREIESLFKVELPLEELEKPEHGYLGVILRDKENDLLQCHICGQWYDSLSQHIVGKHRILTKDYKKRFSLPLSFPLISRRFSKVRSENAVRNNNISVLNGRRSRFMPTVEIKGLAKYALTNRGFQNKIGVCEEQIYKRFLIVSDIVGREPTTNDLIKYDNKLKGIITLRYKNINNFRRKYGFTVRARQPAYEKEEIIAMMRIKGQELERTPRCEDFARPGIISFGTIIRKFGTWNNAIKCAGFPIRLKNEVKYSDLELIACIRKKYEELKIIPKAKFFAKGSPNTRTIMTRFGSWNRALACSGFNRQFLNERRRRD